MSSNWEAPESGNWNNAKNYSEMLFGMIRLCEEYDEIAVFGTGSLMEDFTVSEDNKVRARIQAIKRLYFQIDQIIDASYFAIRKADDKKEMKELKEYLVKLKPNLNKCFVRRSDLNKRSYDLIIEDKFDRFLEILRKIKAKIKEPLTRADLIYTNPEEYDPDKLKQEIMEDLTNSG